MSQHNKGLLTISSPVPHSTEYRTHLERARHGGFQTLDAEHRTGNRRPLNQPPSTTTETDEDGHGQRLIRAKTKTDGDEDRLILGTSEVAAPLQMTKTELDTSLMRPADSRVHEGCSCLCRPRSSRRTAPVLSFLNLLSGKRMVSKR